MFGSKKTTTKDEKPVDDMTPEKIVETYNVFDEVAIHTMPTRYKEMHHDGEQAKKTGMLIIAGGGLVFLVVLAGIGWFVFAPKNTIQAPIVQTNNQAETEVVTETPKIAIEPVVETPVIATPTPDMLNTQASLAKTSASSSQPLVVEPKVATATLSQALDSDADGLLDPEEKLLGTNINAADSDGDTYADLVEVTKGYNPAGTGKLLENPNMAEYSNSLFAFTYPRSWPFKAQDNNSVILTTPDGQSVTVSLSANADALTLENWYKEQFSVSQISANQIFTQTNSAGTVLWNGIRTADNLTYYLMDNNKKNIVAINYNLGVTNVDNFPNIIKVIANTFSLK
ncbi:MAG: hypothetical protein WCG01_02480 [bacterium]